jgi:branched-chain amino acid transport system substrate-binding protein
VRIRARKQVVAIAASALLAAGLVGCSQAAPDQKNPQAELQIKQQAQIDDSGKEVKAADAAAPADPAGDGTAKCPAVTIAMAAALNGPDAALGINIKDGAQLAVDRHNAANPGCQVQLKTFDTEGDPQKATAIAPQIIDDASIVGLVGPGFSGETKATGAAFDQAGLVATTPSATNVTLSQNGWKTFFRGLGNDSTQGKADANYLKNTLSLHKVCVVDDSTDYGVGLAKVVTDTLGDAADPSCAIEIKKGDKDFSAAVTQIKSANPDAVFYSGYYAEAAPFVAQLREAGVTAKFAAGDGSKDPEFVKQAGQSSSGAMLSCPCSPAPAEFAKSYTDKFGQEPGTYSTEGYDLATILLKGIDSGANTRPALLDYVRNYDGTGLGRHYRWTPEGELTDAAVWMYDVG